MDNFRISVQILRAGSGPWSLSLSLLLLPEEDEPLTGADIVSAAAACRRRKLARRLGTTGAARIDADLVLAPSFWGSVRPESNARAILAAFRGVERDAKIRYMTSLAASAPQLAAMTLNKELDCGAGRGDHGEDVLWRLMVAAAQVWIVVYVRESPVRDGEG